MKRWIRGIALLALSGVIVLLVVIATTAIASWKCNERDSIGRSLPQPPERKAATSGVGNYLRPEDDTFLSYPEWYIVWSYQEKADFQQNHLPSGFPYFGAVRQYWGSYCCISRLIRGKYPFNGGEQLMLVVIGSSFSAEYILKGAYEKTVGRMSEWTSGYQSTEEDGVAYQVAREYADFVHVRPFYEFRFARQIGRLWKETHWFGPHLVRKWERKLFLTTDYSVEAFYCWIIEKLTHLTYGTDSSETYLWARTGNPTALAGVPGVRVLKRISSNEFLAGAPRYQEFTTVAATLARQNVQIVEIAGNNRILVSVVAPSSWQYRGGNAQELFSEPILTSPEKQRVLLLSQVPSLSMAITELEAQGTVVEHVYDY